MATEEMKNWLENWKRLGPILEKIEAEELRGQDYNDGLEGFIPLLNWCCKHAEPRTTSGLVEQQRYFMKARQKMLENES